MQSNSPMMGYVTILLMCCWTPMRYLYYENFEKCTGESSEVRGMNKGRCICKNFWKKKEPYLRSLLYISWRDTNLGPHSGPLSPTSGEKPANPGRNSWSLISIRSPRSKFSFIPPAAFEIMRILMPSSCIILTGNAH